MTQQTTLSKELARIDQRIADMNERRQRAEARIRQVEVWLNLYEVSPELAKRNPHLGIYKTH